MNMEHYILPGTKTHLDETGDNFVLHGLIKKHEKRKLQDVDRNKCGWIPIEFKNLQYSRWLT